jgi:6-pyruvoyl-tetrahydropterin synthase
LSYTEALMSVQVTLNRSFVADHFHDRPHFREARHGHNWEVEATITLAKPEEEPAGTLALAKALETWIRSVDYTLLNEQPALAGCNPTTEALAHWAFNALEHQGLVPDHVKVREKTNYWAACRK